MIVATWWWAGVVKTTAFWYRANGGSVANGAAATESTREKAETLDARPGEGRLPIWAVSCSVGPQRPINARAS